MPLPARTAIFDLDGTLVDAVPDIISTITPMLAARQLAPLGYAEAAGYMGDGLRNFCTRVLATRGVTASEQDIDDFAAAYASHPVRDSQLYPDVIHTLQQLQRDGWRLAVCTNKKESIARNLLDQLGVLGYFEVVCGGDAVSRHKPDPEHLTATLRRIDGEKTRALLVGDYRADVEAAKAFGIPCVFAAWGYGLPEMGASAARLAPRFADLPELLNSVVSSS